MTRNSVRGAGSFPCMHSRYRNQTATKSDLDASSVNQFCSVKSYHSPADSQLWLSSPCLPGKGGKNRRRGEARLCYAFEILLSVCTPLRGTASHDRGARRCSSILPRLCLAPTNCHGIQGRTKTMRSASWCSRKMGKVHAAESTLKPTGLKHLGMAAVSMVLVLL